MVKSLRGRVPVDHGSAVHRSRGFVARGTNTLRKRELVVLQVFYDVEGVGPGSAYSSPASRDRLGDRHCARARTVIGRERRGDGRSSPRRAWAPRRRRTRRTAVPTAGSRSLPLASARPCTRPLKKGESNGGATTMGVTATTIKIVLFFINHEQQAALFDAPDAAPAIDRATGKPGYLDQSYRDWEAVLAHSYNTWGRKFEFLYMNPTAPDETAQRADAFRVAEEKPFAVIAPFEGEAFAADLVAKKIVVFVGSVFPWSHEYRRGQASAVPVGRRLGPDRFGSERRAVRREAAEGRDREVVGRLRHQAACSAHCTPRRASTGSTSRAPRRKRASRSPRPSSTRCRSTRARPPRRHRTKRRHPPSWPS